MADNTIANAIKFLKGEEKSLPAAKTEGQVYFAYKNVGTAEKPSYTGAIYIDTPIGGTQNRIKMTANADIADKAFNDSAGLSIRDAYLSSLGYTDDGKQTILIKGSGNNQTRIALPIASTTKSGIVTTDAQSFGGTKTFTTINSTNLTVTGSSGFNYTGIETATGDKARPVWFAYDGINGKPVVNTNFTYNPATQTLSVANLSGTADKAIKDSAGNDIRSTYISNITVNNDIMTITKGSGVTSTLSIKDKLYSGAMMTTKEDLDKFIEANVFKFGHINAIEGYNGLEKNDGIILSASWKSSTNAAHQIFIDDSGYALRHRYRKGGNWSDWASILDSTNYNSYVPTKAGGGAYGTWDINILGNAASANKLNTNAGSTTLPVYFSNGVPVACSTNLAVNITGNAASATKLTSNAGSVIQPIYFKDGIPVPTTYILNAHVQAFSGDLSIGGWKKMNGNVNGSYITVGYNGKSAVWNSEQYSSSIVFGTFDTKGLLDCGYYTPIVTFGGGSSGISTNDNPAWYFKLSGTSGQTYTFPVTSKTLAASDGSNASGTDWGISITGNAARANKLNTNAGSATRPVYFSNGIPVQCDGTLANSISGNAATASKLQTTRTITLAGSVTGSAAFDGSNNITITTSTNHSHSQYLPLSGGTMSGTSFITWADSRNWDNNNNNVTFPVTRGGLQWYGQSDSVKLFSQETASDNLELVLQFEDDNSNGLSIRNSTGTQTARIAANGNITASSFIGNLSGNASTATALTSSAGSSTQPIYFSGGKPVACAYTLSKSVPADAKFTDTNTWRPLGTTGDTACAGNDSRLSNARPASDVYAWAKASSKPTYSWDEITNKPSSFNPSSHTHPYLPLSGGTMTGTINFTSNKLACMFGGSNSSHYSGIMHQTYGTESLVFATTNAATSFIFKCGQNPTSMTSNTWNNIIPSMMIKNQSVYVNCSVVNGFTPAYNFLVNGSTRCDGTLGVTAEIDFFLNHSIPDPNSQILGARIKAYNDRLEFVFS